MLQSGSTSKKHILFLCSERTGRPETELLLGVLALFPADRFETQLVRLTGNRPDRQFLQLAAPLKSRLHLIFSLDCLGFDFMTFGGFPLFNTYWTPCATLLTRPAAQFAPFLRLEWNLNVALLCSSGPDCDYIRRNFPQLDDIRLIPNPAENPETLFSELLSLAERYPA